MLIFGCDTQRLLKYIPPSPVMPLPLVIREIMVSVEGEEE